jgi:hypothetical protein
MRTRPTSSGAFSEKIYYSDAEIEKICESELRSAGFLPAAPEPIRIDRFIEKRFKIRVVYEDLSPGVLGYTTFGQIGVTGMSIASALLETGTQASDRRANATLAHEAGHGLLHTHLFAFAEGGLSLFKGDPDVTATKILCRAPGNSKSNRTYDGKWWEVQANKAIGGLLMPRPLVTKAIQPYLQKRGSLGVVEIDPVARTQVIQHLADVFDVNQKVAEIRISQMYPEQGSQMLL